MEHNININELNTESNGERNEQHHWFLNNSISSDVHLLIDNISISCNEVNNNRNELRY